MQNHYSLSYREEEREMIPLCMDQGLALIRGVPLARGFLTGSRDGGSRLALRPTDSPSRWVLKTPISRWPKLWPR